MAPALNLVFLLSGCVALVYQVAWVRVLTTSFGTTTHAVGTVLTLFMAGLALGGFLLGRRADRARSPLRLYALLELGLAACALLLLAGQDALQAATLWLLRGGALPPAACKFAVAAVALLPPCTLMGGTLPALGRALTAAPGEIGRRLGTLYGLNAAGGVLGCFATALLLLPHLGLTATLLLAAALNLALGLACLRLARAAPAPAHDAAPHATPVPPLPLALAFLSGFATLATEVLWTRALVNLLSANVLILATVVGGFLLGLAAGSLAVARRADALADLRAPLGVAFAASAALLLASVLGQDAFADLVGAIHVHAGPRAALWWALLAVLAVVTPAAAVFGTVFPLLFRQAARGLDSLGADTGRLAAWNTLGCIAGSAAAGFLAIGALGVAASLLSLAALYGVAAALAGRGATARGAGAALAAGALLLASRAEVRRPAFWINGGFMGVARVPPAGTVFLAEGLEGTVGVAHWEDGTRALAVNGVIVAESSPGDLWDLLLKAHLPMLLHPAPRRVGLVGLGAGVSAGAVLAYDECERVDVFEIEAQVEPAHRFFGDVNGCCWQDPRLHLVIEDGRHGLLARDERWDVLSVDPTDPPVVYQYSEDFFRVLRARLAPGGLVVQWLPLFRLSPLHLRVVLAAFARVFPECSAWYDGTSLLLLGGDGPLLVDLPRALERAARPRVQQSLALIGSPDPWLLLATRACGPDGVRRMIGGEVPENSDDHPWLEHAVLLAGRLDAPVMADNLELLRAYWEPPGDALRPADREPATQQRLAAAGTLLRDLLGVRILAMRGQADAAELLARDVARRHGVSAEQWAELGPFVR